MSENKILIVDDEQAIINLFKLMFSRAGYEVASAKNAEDALLLLKKEKIHVMFLDLNMPGMDGVELCRKIKIDMPMSIIFAITGYASAFELGACREAGFDDYFKKPVNIKVLTGAAEDAFKKIERWKKK